MVRMRHLPEQTATKARARAKATGKDMSKHDNSSWTGEGEGKPDGDSGRSITVLNGQVLTSLEIGMFTADGKMMDHGTGIQCLRNI